MINVDNLKLRDSHTIPKGEAFLSQDQHVGIMVEYLNETIPLWLSGPNRFDIKRINPPEKVIYIGTTKIDIDPKSILRVSKEFENKAPAGSLAITNENLNIVGMGKDEEFFLCPIKKNPHHINPGKELLITRWRVSQGETILIEVSCP